MKVCLGNNFLHKWFPNRSRPTEITTQCQDHALSLICIYAPKHQVKCLVCVNLPGSKRVSDSDFENNIPNSDDLCSDLESFLEFSDFENNIRTSDDHKLF